MSQLFHIADRVLNRPLMVLPDKLAVITEVLAGRIGLDGFDAEALAPDASRFKGAARGSAPYRLTEDGVAVISIIGSLVNRGAFIGASSGLISYEGLSHQIESAANDPKVKSIVLDIESPGGEAVGAMETAALIRKAGESKPIHAVVNGMAASAAYALATACKSITSTPSGMSGSIGVVLLHADYSRAIDKAGVTPTLIHAGAHKVDGNPYSPLTGPVKDSLQAEVDKFYQQFLDTVAAGRKDRMTAKAARATEGRVYIGADAKAVGLVDEIGTFDALLADVERSARVAAATRRLAAEATKSKPAATDDGWDAAMASAKIKTRGPGPITEANHGWDQIVAEQNARNR